MQTPSHRQNLSSELLAIGERHWQALSEHDLFEPQWCEHQAQICIVFALSDFVARQCIQHPMFVNELIAYPEQQNQEQDYEALLNAALNDVTSEEQLHKTLRLFRHLHMVRITWADVTNTQSIEDSLKRVSALSQALIVQASLWLRAELSKRFGLPMGELGEQHMYIIGMGKLGGRELNFSSDIDLIFTYPEQGMTQGGRKPIEHQQFFTKLAQKLITALHQITVDGQVYRVDMRLRPFGESGPLVMHFAAMEDYYQEQGREWERYAMVKGRVLNPDDTYYPEIADILRPFIYRRYLDYSALDSLRKMKAMIKKEVRRRQLSNNIKLGQGGIREAEFIVQSLQLIRGGREPALQEQGLLHNLHLLIDMEILPSEDATLLKNSYLWLRKVEHCLQQFDDKQTQVLPDNDVDKMRLCTILGLADYAQFNSELLKHTSTIHEQFLLLIGEDAAPELTKDDDALSPLEDLWLLPLTPEEQHEILSQWLSPEQAEAFNASLVAFGDNLSASRIGQRGENILNKLIPQLLFVILQQTPQAASQSLDRCLKVFRAIYGRTAYLDLLFENQGALKQLVSLCSASPWVTEQISRFPLLLDELLNPAQLVNPTELTEYNAELRLAMLRVDESDLEQQMEALRQFKLCQQLKIAAADITGVLPVMKVSDHLTFLAQSIIRQVVNLAWQQMTEKYGEPDYADIPNEQHDMLSRGFAVIGYGKLGGYELGYGSDLDLVFLHNCTSRAATNGPKSIESGLFYLKLAQRILHLFNTKTASGHLYEVDMRLRPSGNAGLLVCHIDGFSEYQNQTAWTWEHQALTRARFIVGSPSLAQEFSVVRHQILSQKRDIKPLQESVAQMREKMRKHLGSSSKAGFDLKQDSGGIADIEFIVQYYVLAYSCEYPALSKWPDNVRILQQLQASKLLGEQDTQILNDAYLTYRNTNHRLVLQQSEQPPDGDQFIQLREGVSRIWQQLFTMQS
ncbi:bifunctional [glutamate--ammonia ligase]-adenylyl-L-tyrosine phosphorylase/[glutamate--ammonia-ligase] adenylyltransferase [Paraglaciecola polaris]|uniref:Bifunctional glutamine synthetase adenylyltransferase/adenylyl-removing enzyme n=1 Tax=Paraglaciecola polaris LMG 21857 TaxID=1129793 RepID=K6YRH5_9ALTE|nr:bifunctional [glutamate--ammonia ligase]-adenylyl-L-tyrosine phosphorylase/[glutamate--ammonia-ligase] adenylyltransferase [Paraglaciecola polaris]GAC35294.1 glutamate-ammonia-ligase adenylyltransferase [Paraglaciecola polaris LMG 21857]|tara:strand:- start:63731 stop:66631 length:2901 start_codon:yes stop_codon:yes gene_type:complete